MQSSSQMEFNGCKSYGTAQQREYPLLRECGAEYDDLAEQHSYPSASRSESVNALDVDQEDSMSSTERDSITYRNRRESALLKLPAELRNYIWTLAFGWRTVHPRALRGNGDWQPQRRRLKASKWGVSYDPCLETQSDFDMYNLSLLNPEANEWHEAIRPEGGTPGFHLCDQSLPRKFHYLVPPVCKQLWDEASDCVWKTITFAFLRSGDFQHFVHFSGARLDQVRQLCIITPGIDYFNGRPLAEKDKFERGWERALRSGVMSQFKSLTGLHLVLRSFWGTSRWDTHTVEDLIFPPDECLYLPDLIQVFQQLRLRREKTTVLVANSAAGWPHGYGPFTIPKRRAMARLIRHLILLDTPDRDWSGPGQRVVMLSNKHDANGPRHAPI
ncbi:hypothetical protein BU23DRAFT_152640 [Bimuria novae-zelandiae CBS 107.79]|uniref:Uncharacterized protein n=1 Tax=Bimuria novae-zelandiae CBS 107.79 TaxID=1447943 RepID=A0A6A5VS03_9PLEO|nr:hypothetical protein BU23DRAFT_152640 [Bimuria novae-zelandiae CBS 107.79]